MSVGTYSFWASCGISLKGAQADRELFPGASATSGGFRKCVLSETAGAVSRLDVSRLHRRGRPFWGREPRDRFEPRVPGAADGALEGAGFEQRRPVCVRAALGPHYSGLNVAQMQTLRRQMKQAGAAVKVAKNRLAKLALEGTDAALIVPLLKGPTLIAYSGDPLAAPKVAADFAKANEKFVILGGAMGNTALDPKGVKALAALPSLDELRAKIIGLIQAPATKIAQLVNAPGAKLARVVQAYAAKSETA
ncbi:MAG: 50S ribosomal protein L10 [Alphaproteobacteria bacterium]|nr:MAG: 50S ribosomal protein L10 [Alphaproteobacteria bacterium]